MPELKKKSSVHSHRMFLCFLFSQVCWVCSFAQLTSNQSKIQEYIDEQSKLADSLVNMTKYDRRFIPALRGNPLKVELEVVVRDIVKLDDRSMEAEMILYIRQKWNDYRLTWNSSIVKLKVREHFMEKIWLPDFRIINLKEMKQFQISGGINMNIYPNGNIYLSQVVLVKTSCPMDLHNFPLDKQSCFLNFSTFAYGKSTLSIRLNEKKITVKPIHLSQFDFIEAKSLAPRNKNYITTRATIALTFKRRSGYYILQIYIPSMFLVVLSWLAFLMSASDISDRFALEVTMILSIVFLHGGINSTLSHVSYAKASDWFVIVSFAFVLMALFETILVYRLSSYKERRQPKCYKLTSLKRSASTVSCNPNMEEMCKMSPEQDVTQVEKCSMLTSDNYNLAAESGPNNMKPSFIDNIAIVVFPLLYIGFNIFYWWYYLHVG